jgi:hypothetical protein
MPDHHRRDPDEIQQEIEHARDDLAARLGELEALVRDKVDLPARARRAAHRGKQRAKDGALTAVDYVRAHPAPFAAGFGAFVAVLVVAFWVRRAGADRRRLR